MVKMASEFKANFEIERSVEFIRAGRYRRVALQFPDELLSDSPAVLTSIRNGLIASTISTGADTQQPLPQLFILGDTSYGSCCVDEVAAAHGNADLIIHYGHACLSAPASTAVLYVFGRLRSASSAAVVSAVSSTLVAQAREAVHDATAKVLFLWDPDCSYVVPSALEAVARDLSTMVAAGDGAGPPTATSSSTNTSTISYLSPHPSIIVPTLKTAYSPASSLPAVPGTDAGGGNNSSRPYSFSLCGFDICLPRASPDHPLGQDEDGNSTAASLRVVYLGSRDTRSRLFVAHFAGCASVIRIDPIDGSIEDLACKSGRLMSRRYRMVEVIKSASTIGIVAGTLAVDRHTEVIALLRKLCSAAGKGCYTFLLGKLGPAKLGNFPECDVFILVACPEATLMDEHVASTFRQPLATPHEAIVALADFLDDDDSIVNGSGLVLPAVAREWTGRGVMDFQSLLPSTVARDHSATTAASASSCGCAGGHGGGADGDGGCCGGSGVASGRRREDGNVDGDDDDDDDEGSGRRPVHSLITGSMVGGGGGGRRYAFQSTVPAGAEDQTMHVAHAANQATSGATAASSNDAGTAIVTKPSSGADGALAILGPGTAAEYYMTKRQWRGLAYEAAEASSNLADMGAGTSTAIVEGQKGIAARYSYEKK